MPYISIGGRRVTFGPVYLTFGEAAAETVQQGLLIEFVVNGTTRYMSDVGVASDYMYKEFVIGFDMPTRTIAFDYGGYCEMSYGSISFTPEVFEDDWPPPINGSIAIKYKDENSDVIQTIFSGTAHRKTIAVDRIEYGLYGTEYDETVIPGTQYSDNLNSVITEILTDIAEISSVNTDNARSPSPAVSMLTTGERVAIELASEMAAFFGHMFYIDGGTAYLIDMLSYNESRSLTEFEFFFGVPIENAVPVSSAATSSYARTSDYPYGKKVTVTAFHDTEANINDALDDILTILNKPRAVIQMPFSDTALPVPGEKISWTDTAQGQDTTVEICARKFRYDFSQRIVEIEGEGAIS